MRFADLLKTAVVLSMGAATTLAVLTVVAASADFAETAVFVSAGWWTLAGVIGIVLGRPTSTLPPIARVLADAKSAKQLPDQKPGAVVINRLWPMVLLVVLSGGLAVLFPQVPGVAAGFFILFALYWRNQERAVTAIEERDGTTFYVDRTSPMEPIKLIRSYGLRREVPLETGPTGG